MSHCNKCQGFGHVYAYAHDQYMAEDKYLALPKEEKEFFDKKKCDRCEGCGEEPGYVAEYGGLDRYPLMAMIRR